MKYRAELILDYFKSRGWRIVGEGAIFYSLIPNINLNLPENFKIEIPKSSDFSGFDSYISRLIEDLVDLFPDFDKDELEILFHRKNSIIKFRIFDEENVDGTIRIDKFIESIDAFKNVLYNTVSFTVNKQPIFNQTKIEAKEFLNNCKVLQSQKGSYVTRFEIPDQTLHTTFNEISTENINNKLFDVLEFVQEEILNESKNIDFSETYLNENSSFLNYELLNSIKNIYSKSNISNVEFTLSTVNYERQVTTQKVRSKIPYFDNYLKELKNRLFELTTFKAKGYIKALQSNNPVSSDKNELILDSRKFGFKLDIKFHLRSEEYFEAIEAHKAHKVIYISGKAKEYKTIVHITEIEEFKILN